MAKDEPWVEANDIDEKILQIKNKMAEIYCKETMDAYKEENQLLDQCIDKFKRNNYNEKAEFIDKFLDEV